MMIAKIRSHSSIIRNVGVVLLFVSWISQYWFTARLMDKRMKFEYDLAYISNEVAVATPWNILFNSERIKENPSREVLWNASVNYLNSVKGILEVAESYYPATLTETELTSDKAKKVLNRLKELKGAEDPEELVSLTLFTMMAFTQVGEKSRGYIKDKYQALRDIESNWSLVFVVIYIAGSLLGALGFILSAKGHEIQTKKSEIQARQEVLKATKIKKKRR